MLLKKIRSALMGVKGDAAGTEDILDQIVTPSQKESDPKNVDDHGLFQEKTLKDLVMRRLGGKKKQESSIWTVAKEIVLNSKGEESESPACGFHLPFFFSFSFLFLFLCTGGFCHCFIYSRGFLLQQIFCLTYPN